MRAQLWLACNELAALFEDIACLADGLTLSPLPVRAYISSPGVSSFIQFLMKKQT